MLFFCLFCKVVIKVQCLQVRNFQILRLGSYLIPFVPFPFRPSNRLCSGFNHLISFFALLIWKNFYTRHSIQIFSELNERACCFELLSSKQISLSIEESLTIKFFSQFNITIKRTKNLYRVIDNQSLIVLYKEHIILKLFRIKLQNIVSYAISKQILFCCNLNSR